MDDIYEILKTMEIPVAYNKFATDSKTPSPIPPFILYRADKNDNYYAEDNNYYCFQNYIVELVTDKKDINLESKLEALFFNSHIPFEKGADDYIESEEIYIVQYLI